MTTTPTHLTYSVGEVLYNYELQDHLEQNRLVILTLTETQHRFLTDCAKNASGRIPYQITDIIDEKMRQYPEYERGDK